jgi:chromosome segregation ATPase
VTSGSGEDDTPGSSSHDDASVSQDVIERRDVDRLELQIQQLNERVKDAQAHAQTADMQVSSLRQVLNTSKAESEKYQGEAEAQRQRANGLEEKVLFLQLQIGALKREAEQLNETESEALKTRQDEFKARMFDLEEESRHARQDVANLSLQLEEATSERDIATVQVAELRAHSTQLEELTGE